MKKNNLKKVLGSEEFRSFKNKVVLPIGVDDEGKPVFCDLISVGSILIGGATGSGKSTFLHSAISSLMTGNAPDDVKLILIDGKKVELSIYDKLDSDCSFLITPVIKDPKKTLNALRWAWREVCRRFENWNKYYLRKRGEHPSIVIIIDELADLIDFDKKSNVNHLSLIASAGSVVGVHLIIASSAYGSKKVYPDILKDSIRTKIAFRTKNKRDSKSIIGEEGAEKLSDVGQMLFKTGDKIKKLQGFYTDSMELAKLNGVVQKLIIETEEANEKARLERERELGDRYIKAKIAVIQAGKASASLLQRRLRIGYAVAATLLDQLEENGVIGPGEGAKPRDVLASIFSLTEEEKNQLKELDYICKSTGNSEDDDMGNELHDELYEEARIVVVQAGKASASLLQKRLKVGYARAARLLDLLEERGVIGPGEGATSQDVLTQPKPTRTK